MLKPLYLIVILSLCSVGLSSQPVAAREEVAFAVPSPGFAATALRYGGLSMQDVNFYKDIFRLQENGKMKAADRLIAQVGDQRLMGYVKAQRYLHPTAHRSTYRELRLWLEAYHDHPQAKRIYKLAKKREPKNALRLRRATVRSPVAINRIDGDIHLVDSTVSDRMFTGAKARASRRKEWQVIRWVRRDILTKSLAYMEKHRKVMDPLRILSLKGAVAERFFRLGLYEKAHTVALELLNAKHHTSPRGLLYGGLNALKRSDPELARAFLEASMQSKWANPREKAAAAFWLARVLLQSPSSAEISKEITAALKQGAAYPNTFYGLLCHAWLSGRPHLDWSKPKLTTSALYRIVEIPAGRRVIGLLQIGQEDLANDELRRINPGNNQRLLESLIALSLDIGNAEVSLRLGDYALRLNGMPYSSALYPVPRWVPKNGFKTDPSLVFAMMRQESRFKVKARSPVGARGVMQVMRSTARFITGTTDLPSSLRHNMEDPVNNVTLGDTYIQMLRKNSSVKDNLVAIIASYNAGPGRWGRYKRTIQETDSLMFIERISNSETRNHIKKVLVNYWMYRLQFGLSQDGLRDLLHGKWPMYTDHGTGALSAFYQRG